MHQTHPIRFVKDANDCHICTSHRGNTYGYPTIKVAGQVRYISRVVYEQHNGPIPPGWVIRHTCDNPGCINPLHLVAGTPADNVADRVARGRSATGVRHSRAKLTAQQVREIRSSPDTYTRLAKQFGVHRSTIQRVVAYVNWQSVK